MKKRLPDFLIIGAMKCATSTLFDQLNQQEGFHLSKKKEPGFFSHDERFQLGLDWYKELFQGHKENDLLGEATTDYSKVQEFPHASTRIKTIIPDVKIIYIVRNPLERILSHYKHERVRGRINISAEKAIRTQARYLDYTRYATQIETYLEKFNQEQIKIVSFEAITSEPIKTFKEIGEFLGRPHIEWKDRPPRNQSGKMIPPEIRRIVLHPNTKLIRSIIPKKLRRYLYNYLTKINTNLSRETKIWIQNELKEEIQRIGEIMGISELTIENYPETILKDPKSKIEP